MQPKPQKFVGHFEHIFYIICLFVASNNFIIDRFLEHSNCGFISNFVCFHCLCLFALMNMLKHWPNVNVFHVCICMNNSCFGWFDGQSGSKCFCARILCCHCHLPLFVFLILFVVWILCCVVKQVILVILKSLKVFSAAGAKNWRLRHGKFWFLAVNFKIFDFLFDLANRFRNIWLSQPFSKYLTLYLT